MVDVAALPAVTHGRFGPNLRLLWIEGRDLISDAPTWLPYETVHTDYTLPQPPAAAASSPAPTASHRATTCSRRSTTRSARWSSATPPASGTICVRAGASRRRLDLGTVDDADCLAGHRAARAGRLRGCGLGHHQRRRHRRVLLPDRRPARRAARIRAAAPVPTARAAWPCCARSPKRCRCAPPTSRARATICTRASSRRRRSSRSCGAPGALMTGRGPRRDFREVADLDGESFADDLAWLLARLRSVGIEQVVAVDLTRPDLAIPVVRVVIPGLEGPDDHPRYLPGRARPGRRRAPAVTAFVFVGPTLRAARLPAIPGLVGAAAGRARATCTGRRSAGRTRSASSTAISRACPRSGTRRSSGRWRRASTCSAAPAWARCGQPSLPTSACRAWAGSSRRTAPARCRPMRGRSRTTTRSRSSTGRPRPATSRCRRRWSTSARPWRRPRPLGVIEAATRDALAAARQAAVLPRSQLRAPARDWPRARPCRRRRSRRCAPGCRLAGSTRSASMRRRCCAAMDALLASDAGPKQVDYQLEWTEAWDDATLAAAGSPVADRGTDAAWLPARADPRRAASRSAAYRVGPRSHAAAPSRAPGGGAPPPADRSAPAARGARPSARAPRPVPPRRSGPLARGERPRRRAARAADPRRGASAWPDRADGGGSRRSPARRSAPARRLRALGLARPRQAGAAGSARASTSRARRMSASRRRSCSPGTSSAA